ncbi:hypothetical protein Q6264_30140, partial [Klebsiella pneumoniae]|uniref:hypothetical protein n=1 Tax=Klebsiella pneumoniae TaxID=573 RepID=UPI002730FFA5
AAADLLMVVNLQNIHEVVRYFRLLRNWRRNNIKRTSHIETIAPEMKTTLRRRRSHINTGT